MHLHQDMMPHTTEFLDDEWLDSDEVQLKRDKQQKETYIRSRLSPSTSNDTKSLTISSSSNINMQPDETLNPKKKVRFQQSSPTIESEASNNQSDSGNKVLDLDQNISFDNSDTHSMPITSSSKSPTTEISSPSLSLRRSSRANKGCRTKTYAQEYQAEANLAKLLETSDTESTYGTCAYLANLQTDPITNTCEIMDPRVYAAKQNKGINPDMPTLHQIEHRNDKDDWIRAMKLEIEQLVALRAWEVVPRPSNQNVIKGTWAFKLKRLPDNTPYRYKARFCARGDLQREGVDYFETYAPVVQWSTIRLLLTTVLTENWTTRQVDYTNAFTQSDLKDDVYVEFPKKFEPKHGKDMVLKLTKALYGLHQSPVCFYEKLRQGLIDRGYIQSEFDPCLFMKQGIMCVVYVDDTIFAGANDEILLNEIKALKIPNGENSHVFKLRDEGEVSNFLGINIQKIDKHKFLLSQPGLIKKVIEQIGMTDCNSVGTPALKKTLGQDISGDDFTEDWDYRSIVGMLMYLSANTRPDIAFAVHQCARFSHCPKRSHAIAVKRIIRYLKGTEDKGMYISPTNDHLLENYVDSDFAGLYGSEDENDPISAKSRTGFVILYKSVPILWKSSLQTQISVSTMEAEYIALSTSMRDFIPLREILIEIRKLVFKDKPTFTYQSRSKIFTDENGNGKNQVIPQSIVYEDNAACLQHATMPKLSQRTRHIAVPYHWFRTKVNDLNIRILKIDTKKQLGDVFTKGLENEKFVLFRKYIMGW